MSLYYTFKATFLSILLIEYIMFNMPHLFCCLFLLLQLESLLYMLLFFLGIGPDLEIRWVGMYRSVSVYQHVVHR